MERNLMRGSVIYVSPNDTSRFAYISLVVATVGVGLSICAFILLILTAALFAEWRQNQKNQLLVQFMLARMMYVIVRFLIDFEKIVNYCDPTCAIQFDILVLMYTECTLVAWMCRFSKNMNDSLVKVFKVSKYNMWELSFVTWTIPGIISCLFYIAYYIQDSKENYIVTLIYLLFLKWPILSLNAYLLITALKSILVTNKSHTENNVRIIMVMIVLIFIFSFQQVLVDIFKILHHYLNTDYRRKYLTVFNIVAVYQCAISITFWVFGNSNTRCLWRFEKKTKDATLSQLSFRISINKETASDRV